jgi:hypothetical protein
MHNAISKSQNQNNREKKTLISQAVWHGPIKIVQMMHIMMQTRSLTILYNYEVERKLRDLLKAKASRIHRIVYMAIIPSALVNNSYYFDLNNNNNSLLSIIDSVVVPFGSESFASGNRRRQ